ncbi:MAG: hypothetical protein L3K00_03970 [Thermoplasmata archaeon]|nr:hypothetical protein [Thermoplasmata archaeon]MCI4362426.1 hypothetical protein [Thermoplasmata archaeon]
MFFLDSYAILEMARGRARYLPFRLEPATTSRANLLEVFYILAEQGAEELAQHCLRELGGTAVELPLELIPKVARFRRLQLGATGRRFSYVDAFGYVYARENDYAFLTGAHEFEGLPGVCFVR